MSDSFYRSKAWKEMRAVVLRCQPTCSTPGCGARAVAVDHIQPRAKGGADSLANLRALCIPCHNQRRRGGEPRVKGCDPTGQPLDSGHWWHQSATDCGKNSTQLRVVDRSGASPRVSFKGRR